MSASTPKACQTPPTWARPVVSSQAAEPQVDAVLAGGGDDLGGAAGHPGSHRVEVGAVHDLDTARGEARGEEAGVAVGAPGDGPQPVGTVVDGVHAGHDGQEHLRGADVAGGLLAADVLLAGLEREAVGAVAVGVDGDAHEAAGQTAREPLAHGHVAGVRSAEAHRHAEALRGADDDVGAQLAGRGDQGEGEQVGGDGDEGAEPVGLLDHRPDVPHGSGGARVLDQHAVDLALGDLGRDALAQVGDDDLDTGRFGAGADHGDGLRQGVRVDEEQALLVLAHAPGQGHGLGGGGALVEQRGAGGRQPGEVGDRGLEVEQGLQPALGDLGLVRGVRGVPGRVLHDVAQDDRRGEGPVVAEADHRVEDLVAVGQGAQLGQHLGLGARVRQVQRVGVLDHVGDRGGRQFVERSVTDLGEHLGPRLGVGSDVALFEGHGRFERGERCAGDGHGGGLLVCATFEGHHGAGARTASPSVIST